MQFIPLKSFSTYSHYIRSLLSGSEFQTVGLATEW